MKTELREIKVQNARLFTKLLEINKKKMIIVDRSSPEIDNNSEEDMVRIANEKEDEKERRAKRELEKKEK